MQKHVITVSNRAHFFLLLLLSCFSLILISCEENENSTMQEKGLPLQLSANIQSIGGGDVYKLDGGQSFGLWVSSSENMSLTQSDVARNTKFYQSAGGLVSEPRTYWGAHQQLSVYGYYPFDTLAVESPESYDFSVELDQNEASKMVASDLLWTSETISLNDADKKTQLEFQHLMSKLVINVRGSRPDAGTLKGCRAQVNALYSSIVNLKSGIVTATGDAEWLSATSLEKVADTYESSMQVILVPQTIPADVPFLKIITKGNVENEWTSNQDLVLESGQQIVLDVMIQESECIVTIKEISPWIVDDDILYAEAVETLPSYELFDFYSSLGVEGIVISLDEGSNGQHGWIVSTDEAELQWASKDVSSLLGFSTTDAAVNLKLVLQEDPTLETFPAMKWCDDKNKTRTTLEDLEQNGVEGRWIMLSSSTMKNLFVDQFFAHGKTNNLNNLNAAIERASVPSSEKVFLPTIDWNDPFFTVDYWSSYKSGGMSFAYIIRCQVSDYSYYQNSGVFTSISDLINLCKVRAFYHF